LKRRTQLLARVLIGLVAITLIVYVTLDTIYFHIFFTTESAIVGVVYMLIVIVAIFLLLIVQQRERGDLALRSPQKKHNDKLSVE